MPRRLFQRAFAQATASYASPCLECLGPLPFGGPIAVLEADPAACRTCGDPVDGRGISLASVSDGRVVHESIQLVERTCGDPSVVTT